MTVQLSLDDAKTLALNAQGLVDTPQKSSMRDVKSVLTSLGAVQLDTISTLARSHELVHYARTDGVSRQQVESVLWAQPAHTFEYWSHAACILPIEMFPNFATRRRGFLEKRGTWNNMPSAKTINDVKARLKDQQATATDLGGAKKGGDWWDWSETKEALEWLLAIGEVVCTQRTSWRRIYSLTQNAIPAYLLSNPTWITQRGVMGPSDDDCVRALLLDSIRTLGVGTLSDLIDVHRLTGWHTNRKHVTALVSQLVEEKLFIPVQVEGWSDATFAAPNLLKQLTNAKLHSNSTTTLLSPFDSLVWHRERVARLFDMNYRLEAYTPAPKRVYGYFAMPVLHNKKLIARVDPGREKQGQEITLVAKTVTFENGKKPTTDDIDAVAQALRRAATWIAGDTIRVDAVIPNSAKAQLNKAVTRVQ